MYVWNYVHFMCRVKAIFETFNCVCVCERERERERERGYQVEGFRVDEISSKLGAICILQALVYEGGMVKQLGGTLTVK